MSTTTIAPRCQVRNLSTLQYADGFTLWAYRTDLMFAAVSEPGFFRDAAELLAPGDHIHVSGRLFGALLFVAEVGADGVRTIAMCATP